MTPRNFWRACVSILASAAFCTFSVPGLAVFCLCVAWLCVRTAPTRGDRILRDLADGKIRAVWKK